MAPRRRLGCLAALVLVTSTLGACKGKKSAPTAEDFAKRCEKLGKACGDTDKHQAKIGEECKQPGAKLVELGCTGAVIAVYDCYEKELCGKGDKVWTIDDLRVLAERNRKCAAERDAVRECVKP